MKVSKKKLVLVTIRGEAWIKRNTVMASTWKRSTMLTYKGFDDPHKECCVHLIGPNARSSAMYRELVGKKVYAFIDTDGYSSCGLEANPRKIYRKSASWRSASFFTVLTHPKTYIPVASGKIDLEHEPVYNTGWNIPNWLIKGVEDVPCEAWVREKHRA